MIGPVVHVRSTLTPCEFPHQPESPSSRFRFIAMRSQHSCLKGIDWTEDDGDE